MSRSRDRAPGAPGDGTDEQALFEQAMSDVAPLERNRIAPEIEYRTPVPLAEHEREALRELDALVDGAGGARGERELESDALGAHERIEGKVPGLDPRVLKQLRRGEFTIQADLDLHGSDSETARGLVERFVLDAHERSLRCLRIVHGRGKNSPDGVPVLKANLPRWLARGPARKLVLAYASAAPHDGGPGATYVLLRRRGKARARGAAGAR